jgi:hypothetical protein
MRKPALVIVAALALAARPAAADCHGAPCPAWLDAMAYTLAAGIAGGYAYGTGYMVYRDITDPDQSLEYGGSELLINGAGAMLFGGGALDALSHDHVGTGVVLGGLAALHGTLAVHGGWRAYHERDELQPPQHATLWLGAAAWTTNTLLWTAQLDDRHGRAFGLAEAAVNGPIAAGLGYVAYERFASGHGGAGFVYGGLALASGALAIHGLRTAIAPRRSPALDLLGTDVMPTVVDDGHELAPGLGAFRSW